MAEINSLVWEFAKALILHAKDKFQRVTPAEYKERMEICLSCEFIMKNRGCMKCGCHMPTKAGWRTTSCPLDPPKWKSTYVEGEEGTDTTTSD